MENTKKITLISIILIATLNQLSTDIYTPSLPAMAQHLLVTLGQAQGTIAAFALGVAITTLIYGPLSEVIGRKASIITGISIALMGTGICMFGINIHMLYIGRFIQGCGLGACSALWRSIFRDTFSGSALARIGGYFVVAMTLAGILAPAAGGFIQEHLGWRYNFIILFIWTAIVLIEVCFIFKETGEHHGKHRLNVSFMRSSYWQLLTDPLFMCSCFIALLTYGGLFAWFTAGPVILIHGLHVLPSQFGMLMIFTGVSTGASGIIGGKLLKKISETQLLMIGLTLMIISGTIILISDPIIGIKTTTIVIAAMLFTFGSTFVFLICFAMGFKHIAAIAGFAGSLYSCIQLLGGFLFSSILSFINSSHPAPMAWMFITSGIASSVLFMFVIRRQLKV